MNLTLSADLCALLFAGASLIGGYAQAASSVADVITSAVADSSRPEDDRNRDVARKPVESLQFSRQTR
jgi:predicted methyltransferase